MIHKLAKEPLVHFILLGCLIFATYYWLNRDEQQENTIVINQQQLDHLTSLWKSQWKREPTADDIEAVLDRHIRQEVFYREALRMNLDRNDEIVKKRLAQKMEAVASDLQTLMQPASDQRLREYYHEHEEFFRLPLAYRFNQIMFLTDEEDCEARMQSTLQSLRQGDEIPPKRKSKLGVPCDWPLTTVGEIENAFGGDFSRALDDLPTGQWSGPIRSGYGWHLVFIETKQQPEVPDFEQVREFVAREYEYQSELDAQDQVYKELLAKYNVSITAKNLPARIKASFTVE
jgi:peptidyl-prolyl cis-trans isomerase C